MNNLLGEYKKLESEIEAAQKIGEKLHIKANDIRSEQEEVLKGIAELKDRYKAALLANVKGEVSDSDLEKIKFELNDLEKSVATLAEKNDAIGLAIRENELFEKKLIEKKPMARIRFLRAAFDDLAGKISDEDRELVRNLWNVDRHLPGGNYATLLHKLFPLERLDLQQDRWNKFVEKTGIEH